MKKFLSFRITSFFCFAILFFAVFLNVYAATGTIDPNNENKQYAKVLTDDTQINFGCANCNVSVTDSGLTGYAWAESDGWINLNPSTSGVDNDGSGNLSGYAWGESIGWINFNPANGGVSISNGEFDGYAWGEGIGWIEFDCGDVESCVYTDWAPSSGGGGPGSGGGGGDPDCSDSLDNDGDGFVDYPEDHGCTSANDNNEIFEACGDLNADNTYSPIEQVNDHDDNLCTYSPKEGCTDITAINYSDIAEVDDGSCLYAGCTDPTANNYDSNASFPEPGSCQYDDTVYTPQDILGCTDPMANNYNVDADINDGSCVYPELPVFGCLDTKALNYNSFATVDNGNCLYPPPSPFNPPPPPVSILGGTISSGTIEQALPILTIVGVSAFGVYTLPKIIPPIIRFVTAPISLINLIPILFGLRRKRRPWGTVYDSVTKQPLDPVYVTLKDGSGKSINTTITDLDGRYGFLVPAGNYTIEAKKADYVFPSKKLFGKSKDVLYDNLYFGEKVELEKDEGLIIENIPMDPVKFNWNEFAKTQNRKLMRFYSRLDLIFARIANIAFAIGLLFSVLALVLDQEALNIIVVCLYGVVILLKLFGFGPKKPGFVVEEKTGYPLSYGIVRIFSEALQKEVSHAVIGKTGKYYSLVANGKYFMTVEEKVSEDEYKEVFRSGAFYVKNGHINRRIRV